MLEDPVVNDPVCVYALFALFRRGVGLFSNDGAQVLFVYIHNLGGVSGYDIQATTTLLRGKIKKYSRIL